MKTLAQDLQQGKRLEAQNIAIILYFTLRKQRATFYRAPNICLNTRDLNAFDC